MQEEKKKKNSFSVFEGFLFCLEFWHRLKQPSYPQPEIGSYYDP